ncbi:ABC transporter permease [Candidatus Bipolaricaulota bacterium]|nr:ABC transporter permease [Candidatus Bipolaricaulota bacterium]
MKLFKKLMKNPLSLIGLLLILLFTTVAILAPVLAPPQPYRSAYMILRDGFSLTPRPPSPDHPFGTTEGQYDIFYGVIWGTRTAFKIGFCVVAIGVVIGIIIGSISAFYSGIIDEILMRITDIFLSIPLLIAALVLTMVLGKGLTNMMIALITFGWMWYARIIRSEILHIKEMAYVEAARASGAAEWRLILCHILPNSIYPVLVQASMETGTVVVRAAALSFLGVGMETGYADWGQMISYARNWIIGQGSNPLQYWYTIIYPGMAIFLFVLGWTLIGDALRDILDPRMRGKK